MRSLLFVFLILVTLNLCAQPLNKLDISKDGGVYEFNTKKVKLKFNPVYTPFCLQEVVVDKLDTMWVRLSYSDEDLVLVSVGESIEEDIKSIINLNYPQSNSSKLKLHIKDVRVLNNIIPTCNSRLYVSMDFYLFNDKVDDFQLYYSTTDFIEIVQYIEKPMGRLFKHLIEGFYKNRRYSKNNNFIVDKRGSISNLYQEGIYTSFKSLVNDSPTYKLDYSVKLDSINELRSKVWLVDKKSNDKLDDCFVGFSDGQKQYIYVGYYYPKPYYVELTSLNEEYYFIYDRVLDYTQASINTAMYGGGIVGALAGTASAQAKSPALINKKTGRMTSFDKKEMKILLKENSELYEKYISAVNNEDMLSVMELFNVILKDELLKKKLPINM